MSHDPAAVPTRDQRLAALVDAVEEKVIAERRDQTEPVEDPPAAAEPAPGA